MEIILVYVGKASVTTGFLLWGQGSEWEMCWTVQRCDTHREKEREREREREIKDALLLA